MTLEKNDLSVIGLYRQPGDEIYFLKCVNFISEEYWEDFTYVRPDSFMEQVRNPKDVVVPKKFILDKSLSYEQIFDEIAFLRIAINSTEVEPFEDSFEFEYIKDSLITRQEKKVYLKYLSEM